MLYITTKDQKDAHTAYKTLVSDCAADGGLYIPFRLPIYSQEELREMSKQSFGEIVAQILNYFFSAQLTGWDVDFAIGRNPLKLASVGRKITVAELWHNHASSYFCVVKNLFGILTKNDGVAAAPTDWAKVAVRISVLFGIYAEMLRTEMITLDDSFDISMEAGSYFDPISACFACKMGLPVSKIIVCCDSENAVLWDLVHRNEISTISLSSNVRLGIERLLCVFYGEAEMNRFIELCDKKRTYSVNEDLLQCLSDRMFCVVVGKDRLSAVVNSVLNTDNYKIDKKTAISFGAIQDYRAKAGESRRTLVFSENRPL